MYTLIYPDKGHFASVFGPEYIIVDVFEERAQSSQHNVDNNLSCQQLYVQIRFPPQTQDLDNNKTHAIDRFVQNALT